MRALILAGLASIAAHAFALRGSSDLLRRHASEQGGSDQSLHGHAAQERDGGTGKEAGPASSNGPSSWRLRRRTSTRKSLSQKRTPQVFNRSHIPLSSNGDIARDPYARLCRRGKDSDGEKSPEKEQGSEKSNGSTHDEGHERSPPPGSSHQHERGRSLEKELQEAASASRGTSRPAGPEELGPAYGESLRQNPHLGLKGDMKEIRRRIREVQSHASGFEAEQKQIQKALNNPTAQPVIDTKKPGKAHQRLLQKTRDRKQKEPKFMEHSKHIDQKEEEKWGYAFKKTFGASRIIKHPEGEGTSKGHAGSPERGNKVSDDAASRKQFEEAAREHRRKHQEEEKAAKKKAKKQRQKQQARERQQARPETPAPARPPTDPQPQPQPPQSPQHDAPSPRREREDRAPDVG